MVKETSGWEGKEQQIYPKPESVDGKENDGGETIFIRRKFNALG